EPRGGASFTTGADPVLHAPAHQRPHRRGAGLGQGPMMAQSVLIKTDGATLALRYFPGSGEPIVLLHGGPGMGDYFDSFPEILSPPYRVVSYDQRGCGASSCEMLFDVEKQVGDLDSIREHLGADRIHLFGHSWGGLLGQLYAKVHPERVGSLVLCCSMANTGRNVAAMESKGIAERVLGRPKRSRLYWLAAGILLQFPGSFGDLGFGHIMKQLLPNYYVRAGLGTERLRRDPREQTSWRGTNRSIKAIHEDYPAQMPLDAPVLLVQRDQ